MVIRVRKDGGWTIITPIRLSGSLRHSLVVFKKPVARYLRSEEALV